MINKFKGILIGILIGITISALPSTALNGTTQKILEYCDIKICIEGETITPTDANGNFVEPFIIDGTTYLPVRAVANAFGKEVAWDENTHTVYIGEKPAVSYMDAFKTDIKNVIDTYGKYKKTPGMPVRGLKYGNLVDFEKDNIPELILMHDWIVEVYRFDGEKSKRIYTDDIGSRFGQTDVSHTFAINTRAETPCLITYHSTNEWWSEGLSVFTIKEGLSNVEKLYATSYWEGRESDCPCNDFHTFEINGTRVSKADYSTAINKALNGKIEIDACYDFASSQNFPANEQQLDIFLSQFNL